MQFEATRHTVRIEDKSEKCPKDRVMMKVFVNCNLNHSTKPPNPLWCGNGSLRTSRAFQNNFSTKVINSMSNHFSR